MTKHKDDEITLRLKWTDECSDFDREEPTSYLIHVSGQVIATADRSREETLAGRFSVYYVDCDGALNARVPLFDVMDQTQEVHNYYAALIDIDAGDIRQSVVKATGMDFLSGNILILDRLELLPAFRGRGAGLELLRAMIHRFGFGTGLIAMLPFPSQYGTLDAKARDPEWRDRMGLKAFKSGKGDALRKLRSYYATLGFKQLARSQYMVLATDTFR